jgi:CSLREA domain-containing protein
MLASCGYGSDGRQGAAAPIVVTSTDDVVGVDGRCTLREAIEVANRDEADPATGECRAGHGRDVIHFALDARSGSTGPDGVATIGLTRPLPLITEAVIIDGYSQPGARPNAAPSPEPLDGRLVVELDGHRAGEGADGLRFGPTSDGSTIRGLVIGGFDRSGIVIDADDVHVEGSYIGTDPTGTRARGNGFAGIAPGQRKGRGEVIGGRRPGARNLIAANGSSATYPSTGAAILGNFIGTDVSGTRPLPNATVDGAGALSIDDAPDVVVGGGPGGANVISGNASMGIAPTSSTNLQVLGNRIGTDWSGTAPLPNEAGVVLSGAQTGTVIGGTGDDEANLISGNLRAGVVDGSEDRVQILGNTIGLDLAGAEPIPNAIGVATRAATVLGGELPERGNTIAGNSAVNVMVRGADVHATGATIAGNRIGTNGTGAVDAAITAVQGAGVWIAGDVGATSVGTDAGNLILGNRGFGVGISSYASEGGDAATPFAVVVAGNEIGETRPGAPWAGSTGEAIEWFGAEDTTVPYHLLDPTPEELTLFGPDDGAGAARPSRPVVEWARQEGSTIQVHLHLGTSDADARCRVDISLTPASDPLGSRTPLGHRTVPAAGSRSIEVPAPKAPIPSGTLVRAAATCSGGSATGATSELSQGVALTAG